MRKHVEAKTITDERIQRIVVAIDGPVFPELLRTKHEYSFILKLKVFDDGECLERFSQTHAVGKNAAVVF